jgi:hypothetical protein
MNDTLIVTVYVVLDDLLRAMGHRTDCRAQTSDSEVLTVGVSAACQFANHHERALCILRGMGYLSGPLALALPLQSPLPRPRPSPERRRRPPGGDLRHGRGLRDRQRAAARLPPRPRVAVHQGARGGVWRLLRRQGGEVLRVEIAPRRHARSYPSLVPGTLWVACCPPLSTT